MIRHNTVEVMGVPNSINTVPLQSNHLQINSNMTINSGRALDALPKQFVKSMKTLFDILDDQHTGYVKLVDIEKGWQDDGCKELPRGVIDSLRKVTPPSGLLSFERFCAGLKLCLLRNQSENSVKNSPVNHLNNAINNNGYPTCKTSLKTSRPPSAPILEIDNPVPSTPWAKTKNLISLNPHHISPAQRTLSMPQLSPDSEIDIEFSNRNGLNVFNSPPAPPKPPRASAVGSKTGGILTTVNTNPPNTFDKAQIRHALQNWQMGVLLNEMDLKDKRKSCFINTQFDYRGSADGGSSSATDSINGSIGVPVKKTNGKRREPRRHTLQNGIDYNMLRRLKQLEEEREVLLTGVEAVEKAKDWYLQQLVNVQEKIKYLGRMGSHVEQWSEVQQERLNFQRARVHEVNRNLSALADSWERGGFPMHFNLAIRSPSKSSAQRHSSILQSVDKLRQQNRNLNNEVNLKSERIALLEREKQTLMTQLFEVQQRIGHASGRPNSFTNVLSQSSPVCSSSSGGLGDADVVF